MESEKKMSGLLGTKVGCFLWGAINLAPIDNVRVRLSRSVEGRLDIRRRELQEFVNDELGGLSQGGTLKLELFDPKTDKGRLADDVLGSYSRVITNKRKVLHVVKMNALADELYEETLIHELGHGQQMEIIDPELSAWQQVAGLLSSPLRNSPLKFTNTCMNLVGNIFGLSFEVAVKLGVSDDHLCKMIDVEDNMYVRISNIYTNHPIERYPETVANKYIGKTNFIRRK